MTDQGRSANSVRTTDLAADLDDSRVHQAMEDYLLLLQAGQRPDREAFLARYPEVAEGKWDASIFPHGIRLTRIAAPAGCDSSLVKETGFSEEPGGCPGSEAEQPLAGR